MDVEVSVVVEIDIFCFVVCYWFKGGIFVWDEVFVEFVVCGFVVGFVVDVNVVYFLLFFI